MRLVDSPDVAPPPPESGGGGADAAALGRILRSVVRETAEVQNEIVELALKRPDRLFSPEELRKTDAFELVAFQTSNEEKLQLFPF